MQTRSSRIDCSAAPGRDPSSPATAVVGITLLRELREALRGAERAQIERLDADLAHLIAVAEERAWSL
jgi:hypothetical protein